MKHYYLLTALPIPAELGGTPPMSNKALVHYLQGDDAPRRVVEAVMLLSDLLLRDAVLSGVERDDEPVVLSQDQIAGQSPLPDFLMPTGRPESNRSVTDWIWSAYFRHVFHLAADVGSSFLAEWVAFEVSLRNKLILVRAQILGLEAADYQLVRHLGTTEIPQSVVSSWKSAQDPLSSERTLDEARWNWLAASDAWFSFRIDELAALAVKLMLVNRWQRIDRRDTEIGSKTSLFDG